MGIVWIHEMGINAKYSSLIIELDDWALDIAAAEDYY